MEQPGSSNKDDKKSLAGIAAIVTIIAGLVAILSFFGITAHHSSSGSSTPSNTQVTVAGASQPAPSFPSFSFPSSENVSPRLSINPSTGPPGSTITATATGFTPNSLVTFDFQAVQMVQKESNAKGAVTVSFVMPSEFGEFPAGTTFGVDATDSMAHSAQQTFTLN